MPHPPNLLNDDGTASTATMLLLSHHAFRRDIARFIRAVKEIRAGDASRNEALHGEWEWYRQGLHGHHTMEDTNIFPDIRSKHPELASGLDTLTAQHHHIDPLIEKGDAAFADLAHPKKAEAVLAGLKTLLDEHLAFEEMEITPSLRDGNEFPVPADEAVVAMYAQGFAWSMQGIAPGVLEQVRKMLPDTLLAKLPAAQAEFEARSERVWGTYAVGSATTPVPDGYSGNEQAPIGTKGVTMKLLSTVDLGPEIEGMAGRQLRTRMFTIEPGGVIGPIHDHKNRPGSVYILQGTITDHRDGVATDYGPGMGWPEDSKTMHWLENRGMIPAVEISVDIYEVT